MNQLPPPIDPGLELNEAPVELDQEQPTPEEIDKEIKALIQRLLLADQPQRDIELNECKRHELYFRGIQRAVWDDVAKDYRAVNTLNKQELGDVDPDANTRLINITRAFGESFIAALSTSLPVTRFFPSNAETPQDILTSKRATAIAKQIQRHNDDTFLLMRMLYLFYNQGIIAAYNYNKEDEAYGKIKVKEQADKTVQIPQAMCPNCGMNLGLAEEFPPGMPIQCQYCSEQITPDIEALEIQVPVNIEKEYDRSREIIEVYGATHVRIPPYANKQENCIYLVFEFEQHNSLIKAAYPNFAINSSPSNSPNSIQDTGRTTRLSDLGNANSQVSTVQIIWLRPESFNQVTDEAIRTHLENTYKTGIKVPMAQDEILAKEHESLDDHWTLSKSPTTEAIRDVPIAKAVIAINDIRNDLIELTIRNIDYSIPETFVDMELIDYEKYMEVQGTPGLIFPVKSQPGVSLQNSFYTLKTATLSKEADEFINFLDQDARFVTGIYPALYGGAQSEGGKTLGEYEMSRNQAMQRVGLVWKIINLLWPKMMKKAVKSFIAHLKADDKFVVPEGRGFKNVWIRKAELTGEIGEVESETSEQFPFSWPQQRQMLLELLDMGKPQFDGMAFAPENTEVVHRTLGFTDLKIPTEDDRYKQLVEITELLKGSPMPSFDPMTGMPTQVSSIPVDSELDNHMVEAQICRSFLVSEEGLDAKVMNEAGYANVRAHMIEHINIMQMQMPAPAQLGSGEETGAEETTESAPEDLTPVQ